MRFIQSAAIALALSGCATVNGLESKQPDEQIQSAKTIAELRGCIERELTVAPISDRDGNMMFVAKNGFNSPLATLTLIPNERGTLLQERRTALSVTGGWKKCL